MLWFKKKKEEISENQIDFKEYFKFNRDFKMDVASFLNFNENNVENPFDKYKMFNGESFLGKLYIYLLSLQYGYNRECVFIGMQYNAYASFMSVLPLIYPNEEISTLQDTKNIFFNNFVLGMYIYSSKSGMKTEVIEYIKKNNEINETKIGYLIAYCLNLSDNISEIDNKFLINRLKEINGELIANKIKNILDSVNETIEKNPCCKEEAELTRFNGKWLKQLTEEEAKEFMFKAWLKKNKMSDKTHKDIYEFSEEEKKFGEMIVEQLEKNEKKLIFVKLPGSKVIYLCKLKDLRKKDKLATIRLFTIKPDKNGNFKLKWRFSEINKLVLFESIEEYHKMVNKHAVCSTKYLEEIYKKCEEMVLSKEFEELE